MKVLWLINVPTPKLAKSANLNSVPFGGWLVQLLEELNKHQGIDMYVLFKQTEKEIDVFGVADGIRYCGFYQDVFKLNQLSDKHRELFKSVLKDFNPDVIQIFGTEHLHAYDMLEASKELHYIDRTIITIQGMVSVYAKHYFADTPLVVRYGYSLRDVFRGNINMGRKQYVLRGKFEEDIIKNAYHAIGRTDWDEACVKRLNPRIKYYYNNETLRESFYHSVWDYNHCERYSIFCSQASHPIKGIHYLIEALPEIIEQYPNTMVYISGEDYTKKSKLKQTLYQKYIIGRIKKLSLENHITFVGTLNEKQMVDQYLKANVFVCPSSIENSPNSVGEAMILGIPTVSADVGGVKNMLVHNEEGYVYQHDAPYMLAYYIMKIFAANEDAQILGNAARKHALKTHDIETNINDLIDIYVKIMGD